jgi:hypothetical protein
VVRLVTMAGNGEGEVSVFRERGLRAGVSRSAESHCLVVKPNNERAAGTCPYPVCRVGCP